MSHDARFSIIPGWIVTDPRLRGRDLQVLCLLGRHTDKHGWCRRSQVKMADQLGCARSTVQASLDRLGDIGVVEKHVEESRDGRDSAHSYRVIYDAPPPAGYDFDAYQIADDEENHPISTPETGTPPAGISAPPAGPESAPPAGPGSAPINDPYLTIPPKPERQTRERDFDGISENDPKAALKTFKQWYPTWPTYVDDSEPKALKAWMDLTLEERNEAAERSEAYIAAVKAAGRKYVCSSPVYLAEKRWRKLDALEAVKPKQAGTAASGRTAVGVFGPAYAAARMLSLLDGPVDFDLPPDLRERVRATFEVHSRRGGQAGLSYRERLGLGLDENGDLIFPDDFERQEWRRRLATEGFPEVNRLHDAAKERSHVTVDGAFERMKLLCEFVPVGSQAWQRWRELHELRGWPFVPTPAGMKGVYFPIGGPEGLEEFERAARSLMQARDEDDAA
ncbi:hypothetical protein [Rhizobium oryzicola]|uniref:Helix-turn-helix domain-containing protein n=1 Tax=Rhizobium oryzicola TaxID=1232668 RepID=A0ABT8SVE5_9HYPH|nr:hypothetical protein [Rhizobium oryzicola]MDO1582415.1 hypothetical protein [Rhizobium oryzicola]